MSENVDRDSVASQCSLCREQFEEWVSADPYAKSLERYPDDPEKFAWPGVYKDINTDLAWQAWQEAWNRGVAAAQESLNKGGFMEFEETSWRLKTGTTHDFFSSTRIDKCKQSDGSYKYSVRSGPYCLSQSGEWEYEPIPSSRDEDFIRRCRFDSWDSAAVFILCHLRPKEEQ